MIQDHTDHGTPKELNPYPEWIHVLEFFLSVPPWSGPFLQPTHDLNKRHKQRESRTKHFCLK